MEKRKLENLASSETDATIVDARCRLNTHDRISAWVFKGCFVHSKICKLHTFRATSFKDVSFIVCFIFYCLKNDSKMTKKWSEPHGSGDSPWSSTVAVNALSWKIQQWPNFYWVYIFTMDICCKKKKNKKVVHCYPHCFPCYLQLITQSILYLLSPLKTLE